MPPPRLFESSRLGRVAVQFAMALGDGSDLRMGAERIRTQQDDAVAPLVAETPGEQRNMPAAIGGHHHQFVVTVADNAANLVDHQADMHVVLVEHDDAPFVRCCGVARLCRVLAHEPHEAGKVDHRNRRAAQVQHADADLVGERRRMHGRHADDLLNGGHRQREMRSGDAKRDGLAALCQLRAPLRRRGTMMQLRNIRQTEQRCSRKDLQDPFAAVELQRAANHRRGWVRALEGDFLRGRHAQDFAGRIELQAHAHVAQFDNRDLAGGARGGVRQMQQLAQVDDGNERAAQVEESEQMTGRERHRRDGRRIVDHLLQGRDRQREFRLAEVERAEQLDRALNCRTADGRGVDIHDGEPVQRCAGNFFHNERMLMAIDQQLPAAFATGIHMHHAHAERFEQLLRGADILFADGRVSRPARVMDHIRAAREHGLQRIMRGTLNLHQAEQRRNGLGHVFGADALGPVGRVGQQAMSEAVNRRARAIASQCRRTSRAWHATRRAPCRCRSRTYAPESRGRRSRAALIAVDQRLLEREAHIEAAQRFGLPNDQHTFRSHRSAHVFEHGLLALGIEVDQHVAQQRDIHGTDVTRRFVQVVLAKAHVRA